MKVLNVAMAVMYVVTAAAWVMVLGREGSPTPFVWRALVVLLVVMTAEAALVHAVLAAEIRRRKRIADGEAP